ncbi:hypothetical protein Tco_0130721, partial [Tanacetum coccineum]
MNYPQARRTFVPSGVLTRIGLVNPVRPNEKRAVQIINTARPVSTARSVSTARPFALKIAQTSSAVRPIYPNMDNVRPRALSSQIKMSYNTKPVFRPKNLKQDVKNFGIKNITTAGTRAVVNTGKGKMENDLKKSRTATTSIESNKPLVQDEDGVDVDVHVYRSMIGSLMYLTASRPY